MGNKIILELVLDEVYSRHYRLDSNQFGGREIMLFAECSKNPEYTAGSSNYFFLVFHFSVDDYSPREHIVGMYIGEAGMSKPEIDGLIDEFACDQVNNDFQSLVEMYIRKETLWQKFLDSEFQK